MKNLIYLFLFLATGCTGQTADFTTNNNSYYHWAETKVKQSVRVELTEAGLLTLTDQRTGNVIERHKVRVTDRNGVLYCLSPGNNLSGRFYRAKTELYVDPVLKFVEVWKEGAFHSRYGTPEPITLN